MATIESLQQFVESRLEGQLVLVRDHMAGVIIGFCNGINLAEGVCVLTRARKVHSWTAAAAVEGLATRGAGEDSKITPPVDLVVLRSLVQVIPMAEAAMPSTYYAKEWSDFS